MNGSSAVTNGSSIKWLSDILLLDTKYNQTFFDVSGPFLPFQLSIIPLIVVHFLATIINAFLLTSVLMERHKKQFKIKILISSLTLVHLIWSAAWVFICLTAALFPVDKIREKWIEPMGREEEEELKILIWELAGRQTVDNLYFTIMLYFLAISLERYLNLLPNYDPYAASICSRFLIAITPWVLAYTVFDHRLIALVLPMETAAFCRLCLLMIPSLFSFLFSLIACIRPAKKFESFSSLNSQLPILLFIFSFINLVMSSAFFIRLLEENFGFIITTANEYEDHLLTSFLDTWFWIARCFIHIWALFFPLCLMIFVRMYREMASLGFSRIFSCLFCCCCRKKKTHYNQETLRSIIGSRNLVSSVH